MANDVTWALSHTQIGVEVIATFAFALSGVIEGARKRLDAEDICVVAGLAVFGGARLAAADTATALRVVAVLLDWRLPAWQVNAASSDEADGPPRH